MNRNRRFQLAVAIVAVLVTLSMLIWRSAAPAVQAQEGDRLSDRFQSAEPPAVYPEEELDAASAYLQIPGSALRPENSPSAEWTVDANYPGCIYIESGNVLEMFNVPIFPPRGATLTKVRVYVYDASAYDTLLMLDVFRPYGDEQYAWANHSSGSSGYSYFEINIPNHVVDYSLYSYALRWLPCRLGPEIRLCSMRLYYFPAGGLNYLPAVMKGH